MRTDEQQFSVSRVGSTMQIPVSLGSALLQALAAVSLLLVPHCLGQLTNPVQLTHDYKVWASENYITDVITNAPFPFYDTQSLSGSGAWAIKSTAIAPGIAWSNDAPRLDLILSGAASANANAYKYAEAMSDQGAILAWSKHVSCPIFVRVATTSSGEFWFSPASTFMTDHISPLVPNGAFLVSAPRFGGFYLVVRETCTAGPFFLDPAYSSYKITVSVKVVDKALKDSVLYKDPLSGCEIQLWICQSAFKVLRTCDNDGSFKLVGACEFDDADNEPIELPDGRFRWLNYELDGTPAHNAIRVRIWEWNPNTGKLKKFEKSVPFVREALRTNNKVDLGVPYFDDYPTTFDTNQCNCGSSVVGRSGKSSGSGMISYSPICSLSVSNVIGMTWDYSLNPSRHIGARVHVGDQVRIEAKGFVSGSVGTPAALAENGGWSCTAKQNGYLIYTATTNAYISAPLNGFLAVSGGGTSVEETKVSASGEWIGMTGIVAAPESIDRIEIKWDGNRVAICWNTNATNASIEWTASVGKSNVWTTLTAQPIVVNGKNTIYDQIQGSSKYYRMKRHQ